MDEGKSARSRRVGTERGVCGVARLVHSIHYGPRRAPCIRSLSLPTRLTRNTQTGSRACSAGKIRSAAATVASMSEGVCAAERKPASKADGARYTPASSMA